jgi:single-stranded-DNA-specific exonuclease
MKTRELSARSLRGQDLLEAVALARGCRGPAEVAEFLDPHPTVRNHLSRLPGYAVARERIRRALASDEAILLFGDYDCDGITSLVQMHDLLSAAGHRRMNWFVPNRIKHEYGLTPAATMEGLDRFHPGLIIALDCGSAALSTIAGLRESGIECIVVDHHAVPAAGEIPHPAVAHLNPKAWGDSGADMSALQEMSAAGLTFLFCEQLALDLGLPRWNRSRSCILAGLGTLVDVMPLLHVNRALVKEALRLANDEETLAQVPGLQALREVSGASRVDARVFAFRWGPRLNAGGRVEDAFDPVSLLLARDLTEARPLAERCHQTNRTRQGLQQEIEADAVRRAAAELEADPSNKVLLLCSRDWHPGIVGIVAGRLREKFVRPAIVCGWHEDGYWKGSGRSPEGFDLGATTQAAVDAGLMMAGGGHRLAAGMKIDPAKLDALKTWLEEHCALALEDLAPVYEVLAPIEAPARQDPLELARCWCALNARLEPFGASNPQPCLRLSDATLRWGPRVKTRREGGSVWAASAGFSWAGRGNLFVDWTDTARAEAEWVAGSRYDLLLTVSSSDGIDRQSGLPTTWYNWKVVDCEGRGSRIGDSLLR